MIHPLVGKVVEHRRLPLLSQRLDRYAPDRIDNATVWRESEEGDGVDEGRGDEHGRVANQLEIRDMIAVLRVEGDGIIGTPMAQLHRVDVRFDLQRPLTPAGRPLPLRDEVAERPLARIDGRPRSVKNPGSHLLGVDVAEEDIIPQRRPEPISLRIVLLRHHGHCRR